MTQFRVAARTECACCHRIRMCVGISGRPVTPLLFWFCTECLMTTLSERDESPAFPPGSQAGRYPA